MTRPPVRRAGREIVARKEKGWGNPAFPVQQGSLGLAVPTTPETAAMETTTDAVRETATPEMGDT